MPSLRFHPLLLAGAACLALAACGSDDDSPTQADDSPTQAGAAAQTAPTQTAPEQAPSDQASKDQQAPKSPLANYAAGGAPATPKDADDIHATLVNFQAALARKDIVTICALTVGLPKTGGSMSCESLADGPAEPPPADETRRLAAESPVTVKDDKATAELTPGFLMPLRRVDGRWLIDYRAINNPESASR